MSIHAPTVTKEFFMLPRGATRDENESPPLEGCRSGLAPREDPPLKAKAFSLPKRGFSRDTPHRLMPAAPLRGGIFSANRRSWHRYSLGHPAITAGCRFPDAGYRNPAARSGAGPRRGSEDVPAGARRYKCFSGYVHEFVDQHELQPVRRTERRKHQHQSRGADLQAFFLRGRSSCGVCCLADHGYPGRLGRCRKP